jgi:uncharacterized protein YggE
MPRSEALLALTAAMAFTPAVAATSDGRPRIVVVGHGSVRTDPDTSSLTFTIRGEGATSDDAARELVRKRDAISDGLSKLLGPSAVVQTGELSIKEARDRACDKNEDQPKLSSGACAVRGYVATIEGRSR